jgi:hypothetical protein
MCQDLQEAIHLLDKSLVPAPHIDHFIYTHVRDWHKKKPINLTFLDLLENEYHAQLEGQLSLCGVSYYVYSSTRTI